MSNILGIESSCDDTAASVVTDGHLVRSSVIASQIAKHAPYGGVVPELAAREHLKAIEYISKSALEEAGVSLDEIDAVAVTNGPGLMPSLLVGVNFAKGVAAMKDLPLIGVNHFMAHIYSVFLDDNFPSLSDSSIFPLLALVVSGGHTALMVIQPGGQAKLVGSTLDDAAGEAFDKGAKMLDLGYPGGPVIEKLASRGDSTKYKFPRSLTGDNGKKVAERHLYDFSFSGVKTALLYHCRERGGGEKMEGDELYDTIASYQEAIIDALCRKTLAAATKFAARSLVICGGVACNNPLRERFEEKTPSEVKLMLAPKKYCSDNAAMVAGLGWHHFRHDDFADLSLDAYSRLPELTMAQMVIS